MARGRPPAPPGPPGPAARGPASGPPGNVRPGGAPGYGPPSEPLGLGPTPAATRTPTVWPGPFAAPATGLSVPTAWCRPRWAGIAGNVYDAAPATVTRRPLPPGRGRGPERPPGPRHHGPHLHQCGPVPGRRKFTPADLRQHHDPPLHVAFRPVVPTGLIVLRHQQHPRRGAQHVVPVHHRAAGRTRHWAGGATWPCTCCAVWAGRWPTTCWATPSSKRPGLRAPYSVCSAAYFVVARRASANTSSIVALIAINLVFSFTVPDIAWQAHVGGLVTGLVVAAGLGALRHRRQELVADVAVVAATCVALGLLLLLAPGVANLG